MIPTWREFALCKNQGKLFFSADSASTQVNTHESQLHTNHRRRYPGREAIDRAVHIAQICTQCPVIEPCRQFALETNQRFGIWGGLSWWERRDIVNGIETPPKYRSLPEDTVISA